MYARLQIAIGLLSAGLLACQIVLLQVFSFVQWYHFAYMIISVALLGFGASGTVLAVARSWFTNRAETVLPSAMLMSGVSVPLVLALTQLPFARFESYLLLTEARHVAALFATYLLLSIPFFSGAIAIGLSFVVHTGRVGGLYFANLVGSALGGALGLWLLNLAPPEALIAVTGMLGVGGASVATSRWTPARTLASTAGFAVCVVFTISAPALKPSEYKDLSRTRLLPNVETVAAQPSAHGLLHVLRSPSLRRAPGLSLAYRGNVQAADAVFINGDAVGAIPSDVDSTDILDFTTAVLPYALNEHRRVLILGSGTGEAIAHALSRHATSITAVEPHPQLTSLLTGTLAAASDSLLLRDGVRPFAVEPRTFLASDTTRYDLIVLPTIGSFGGSAGLFALQEQYGLTVDAFTSMWERLDESGALAVTSWMDYPYRNPLRVAATLVEMLQRAGVEDPTDHLAAVRSWGTVTFVAQRQPFTADQIERVRLVCRRLLFDPVLLPGVTGKERVQYNQVLDNSFFNHVDAILSDDRQSFYSAYPFRVAPATDNRPYFSQFVRWNHIDVLRTHFGDGSIPFFELGTLIVALTLIQIAIAALVLIVVPLARTGWVGRRRWWTFLYFGGLGTGYMFFEIIMIQRYVLFFGHSVLAVAAVFTILLFGSGIGSLLSQNLDPTRHSMALVAGGVAAMIFLVTASLPAIMGATIHAASGVKVVIAIATLGPVAILMGMPFPVGLRSLAGRSPTHVPWAWGINGCLSVTSTAAATLLLVEAGATAVLLLAAAAYLGVAVTAVMPGHT